MEQSISAATVSGYPMIHLLLFLLARRFWDTPLTDREILARVCSGEQALTPICRKQENGEQVCIAEGFERREVLTPELDRQTILGSEHQLVVRSLKQARATDAAMRARLEKAQKALAALNERGRGKKQFSDEASVRKAA
jgi:hypothetical protein